PGLAGAPVVRLLDRLNQLNLGHPAAAADLKPLRQIQQVRLAGVGVDAAGGLGPGAAAARRLGVTRALLGLGLPVVADLLERVLDRRERGAVGAFALAVLLDGRVV